LICSTDADKGTEVFELNADLRSKAVSYARRAGLRDSERAQAYRSNYKSDAGVSRYAAGAEDPSIVECDVTTSDVWFSGDRLSQSFSNYTHMITNGTGIYCVTGQEDNATLEALLRGSAAGLLEFSRIILMRAASDFDRPYPGLPSTVNLFQAETLQGAFEPAVRNTYLAGIEVVRGILCEWRDTYKAGVAATNYVGDIRGTLEGVPDFGPGARGMS